MHPVSNETAPTLTAEVDIKGRIHECSEDLARFVDADHREDLFGLTLDELAVTGGRRTLARALADANVSGLEVGPIDLWLQIRDGRVSVGRFWVRPADVEDRFTVRGVDLASLDAAARVAALESMLLGWVVSGVRTSQCLRGLAQLVEWQLPGMRCALGVLEDDGVLRMRAAPSVSSELQRGINETSPPLDDVLRGVFSGPLDAAIRKGHEATTLHRHLLSDMGPEVEAAFVAEGLTEIWSLRVDGVAGAFIGMLGLFATADLELDGTVLSFLRHVADIVAVAIERDQGERDRIHDSLHDALTGLPNRRHLIDDIDRSLAESRRGPGHTAVLMIDLDEFKVANDSLSHAAGDEVLVHVARRLQELTCDVEKVGRFGGDEFLVVTTVESASEAVGLAERIRGDLDSALRVGDEYIRTAVSIGVAVAGVTDDPKTLLRDADAALHRAKGHGRNRSELFDRALRAEMLERMETETALRRGLTRREIEVHYQPIVRLSDPVVVVGAEALVRWRRNGTGPLLPPGQFLPAAENAGLMNQMGLDTLAQSAELAAELRAGGFPDLTISVNVSPTQLTPRFVASLAAILGDSGVDPSGICLEITESGLVWEGAEAIFGQIAALGVGIAIDDFGTGYSSLNHLRRFPMASDLKVDRTFVSDLEGPSPSGQAIVSATISLGHSLGMTVTAEGVETPAQVAFLRELACDNAEGFLISRAVPASELRDCFSEVVGRVGPS